MRAAGLLTAAKLRLIIPNPLQCRVYRRNYCPQRQFREPALLRLIFIELDVLSIIAADIQGAGIGAVGQNPLYSPGYRGLDR